MSNLDFVTFAGEVAREAGDILLQYAAKRPPVEYKGDWDVVTAADRASEKLIVERLRGRFPSHNLIGEEGGGVDHGSEYTWYIDPLDGTTNFTHSFPRYCVSIGLWKGNEGIAGVVFDPVNDEFFAAEKGSGAYLNNQPIRASSVDKLAGSLLSTGFPSARRHQDGNIQFFHQASMVTHGIRREGSAALDLSFVASGRLEAFWEFGLKSWDVAAGLVIASEAGGRYSTLKAGEYTIGGHQLVTTNSLIHDELIQLFADVFAGKYRFAIPAVETQE